MSPYGLSVIYIILTVFDAVLGLQSTVIVQTNQGKVEGYLASHELCYEFWGIKYAEPVKFRAPIKPASHSGIYKAKNGAISCPQYPSNDILASPSDTEDCLFLNIFSPNVISNASAPVMLYLHGGGFGLGSGSPEIYGPQYLVSHGVVVVTLNYRLNVYGFLNLGIEEAPGNAGLKDIRAALRWIRDNIRAFGGDPDNVTVFGQGSGGVAALYLTLSESTKGLFHRVISESGSFFTPQSFDPTPLSTASQIAKSLGVNTRDPEELLALYSETDVVKVEEAISKQMNAKSIFRPTVEDIFNIEEPFLTDTPYNILTTDNHKDFNPVPVLVGLNTVEAVTCTIDYHTITGQMDRIQNEDFTALDQKSFRVPKEDREEFREILKETYFTNITSDEALVGGLINLNSDFSYVGPLALFSELYYNQSGLPVYQYIFNYIGNRNLGRLLTSCSLPATTNMDELFYIFELEKLPLPMDENDARMVTFMTMMWTNFAKFGTPTPDPGNGEWLPYPYNLAIALEPAYVASLTPERAYFWRSLYLKYGAEIDEEH